MIKFFDLHKNNKEKDNQPDYRISFNEDGTFVEGGACWKKKDKNGNTYLSCKLREKYEDKAGYMITEEGSTKPKTALEDEEL